MQRRIVRSALLHSQLKAMTCPLPCHWTCVPFTRCFGDGLRTEIALVSDTCCPSELVLGSDISAQSRRQVSDIAWKQVLDKQETQHEYVAAMARYDAAKDLSSELPYNVPANRLLDPACPIQMSTRAPSHESYIFPQLQPFTQSPVQVFLCSLSAD
jgi:hypothetical protein